MVLICIVRIIKNISSFWENNIILHDEKIYPAAPAEHIIKRVSSDSKKNPFKDLKWPVYSLNLAGLTYVIYFDKLDLYIYLSYLYLCISIYIIFLKKSRKFNIDSKNKTTGKCFSFYR